MTKPKISFGLIVFNGDEFLKETLDAVYDFAHEIIIIEGADKNAMFQANKDGSSTDRTIEIIKNYQDPNKKIRLIQGKWNTKNEACNEYLKYATGDYVWHLDDDEIYKETDIEKICKHLLDNPEITAVAFHLINFFKGFKFITVPGKRTKKTEIWRIFKFKKGYCYSSHRPPTMIDPNTKQPMNDLRPWHAEETAKEKFFIYHCSYISTKQVEDKILYHINYRLNEAMVGIPHLPYFGRFVMINAAWQWAWKLPIFKWLRKKLDKNFNYDYMDTVWNAWEQNRAAVELRFGVMPTSSGHRFTVIYDGDYPKTIINHPLFKI